MTPREQVHRDLVTLGDPELRAVAHVVAALRARQLSARAMDPVSYGPLYREFAAEDRALAERGMAGFAGGLELEDRS